MRILYIFLKKYRLLAVGLLVLLVVSGIILVHLQSTDQSRLSVEGNTSVSPKKINVTSPAIMSSCIPSKTPSITPVIDADDIKYDYDLYSLNCYDDKNLWVVKWYYNDPEVHNTTRLFHSEDGGVHWESYVSKDCLLQEVSFADRNHGWAVALEGSPELSDGESVNYQILYSEDGGKHWKVQLAFAGEYSNRHEIESYDKNKVSIIINGGLYQTEDGGKHWNKEKLPLKDFLAEHIIFSDDRNGWLSGVVKTKAESDHKKASSDDTVLYTYKVCIFHTTDGAKSWRQQYCEDDVNDWRETIDISFADANNGWFLSMDYGIMLCKLYHTTDGGTHWKQINELGVRPYVQELEAVSSKFIWIPLHSGAGPIEGGLLYSTDGGKNLTFIGEESGFVNSNGIEFADSQKGWAIMNGFQDKYLMKTSDGGRTWNRVNPDIIN